MIWASAVKDFVECHELAPCHLNCLPVASIFRRRQMRLVFLGKPKVACGKTSGDLQEPQANCVIPFLREKTPWQKLMPLTILTEK